MVTAPKVPRVPALCRWSAEKTTRRATVKNWASLNPLAAAHAKLGDFEAAADMQRQAIDLAPNGLKARLRPALELYRKGERARMEATVKFSVD